MGMGKEGTRERALGLSGIKAKKKEGRGGQRAARQCKFNSNNNHWEIQGEKGLEKKNGINSQGRRRTATLPAF